jgi:hypothetical protein
MGSLDDKATLGSDVIRVEVQLRDSMGCMSAIRGKKVPLHNMRFYKNKLSQKKFHKGFRTDCHNKGLTAALSNISAELDKRKIRRRLKPLEWPIVDFNSLDNLWKAALQTLVRKFRIRPKPLQTSSP